MGLTYIQCCNVAFQSITDLNLLGEIDKKVLSLSLKNNQRKWYRNNVTISIIHVTQRDGQTDKQPRKYKKKKHHDIIFYHTVKPH